MCYVIPYTFQASHSAHSIVHVSNVSIFKYQCLLSYRSVLLKQNSNSCLFRLKRRSFRIEFSIYDNLFCHSQFSLITIISDIRGEVPVGTAVGMVALEAL